MYSKILTIVLFAIICTGCTLMNRMAGLGVVSQHTSQFDNATVIEVSPNWLSQGESMGGNTVKLGARWSSAKPNNIVLDLLYSSTVSGSNPALLNITGIDIKINGEEFSFDSIGSTDFDKGEYISTLNMLTTESKNSVVIPFSLLKRMANAENCHIRIHTSEGYEDSDFTVTSMNGVPTAKASIRYFLEKVQEYKKNS